jgi:hypothetical protein
MTLAVLFKKGDQTASLHYEEFNNVCHQPLGGQRRESVFLGIGCIQLVRLFARGHRSGVVGVGKGVSLKVLVDLALPLGERSPSGWRPVQNGQRYHRSFGRVANDNGFLFG